MSDPQGDDHDQAAGYNPDTLILTPGGGGGARHACVSGVSGGTNDFVFAPGQFAPEPDLRAQQADQQDDRRRRRRRQPGAREALHQPGHARPLRGGRRDDEHAGTCGWSSTPCSAASAPRAAVRIAASLMAKAKPKPEPARSARSRPEGEAQGVDAGAAEPRVPRAVDVTRRPRPLSRIVQRRRDGGYATPRLDVVEPGWRGDQLFRPGQPAVFLLCGRRPQPSTSFSWE